jgi:antitoxin PrlF
MPTATITSRGLITIPVNVRQALAGDRVEFVQIETGQFLLIAANHSVTELKGMFGKPTKVVSVQEMNQAVAARGMEER